MGHRFSIEHQLLGTGTPTSYKIVLWKISSQRLHDVQRYALYGDCYCGQACKIPIAYGSCNDRFTDFLHIDSAADVLKIIK